MMHSIGRPIHILLVEDNPGDIRLAQEALRRSKINNKLSIARDGVEAIEFLRKQGDFKDATVPDLILLDLNLPRKDGREVLEEIKADPALQFIPVVVLTTSKAEEDVLRSYRLHANCYISKPPDIQQLVSVVQSIETFWFSIVTLPPKH